MSSDTIIKAILDEEHREKQLKKKRKGQVEGTRKNEKKGKTLEEMEKEEGGPVQESLVPMAQTQRAAKRKGAKDADTSILEVSELQRAEEELEAQEDDGVKLEAFNLKEERARGHFDEAGNYVQDAKGSDEEEEEEDAWLKSEEATVVSEEVRRRLKQQEADDAAAAMAAAQPLTAAQVARLQHEAAALLEPGESVAAGLRRLGAGLGRRPGKQAAKAAQAAGAGAVPDPDSAAKFERLTALGVSLMEAGETDVYTQSKEYFARAAAVYIDADEGPSSLFGGSAPATTAYDDADEDMFGGGSEASAAAHYAAWPVKELRRFLTERGQDPRGIVEKDELVARVAAAAAEMAAAVPTPPQGYVYDPASKFWYSAASGMHWDAKSGGFYSGESGKWYVWDASSQQFVEWTK
ncbi:CD2 antigen cytoplasmic tail-binding protein 2 [Auxenochlorella protothecoides]|uniref:CD2 antigen cytoplasmic tail-binding protein 2 n=1 Tax=Auxenochlorella protothecoides TaxID=3075 RepID=A0A087SH03_AUXPR|nr:CD2 antigen cytoplasmic tail-binding protein 2 [Auxenochlorella protothecoides]KFM25007.1 CD2 antigen cytoplasmic tail-binding protein 2 [Auxenochlorella protothecoides]